MADTVRCEIYLTAEQAEALERLRVLAGKKTIAETIVSALKLYGVREEEGVLKFTGGANG